MSLPNKIKYMEEKKYQLDPTLETKKFWVSWFKIFISMPRPQKKEINFTKDSILSLMQEIYNELVEQRNTAIRIQNKMISMMKEPEDMKSIGPVIEKQQRVINDCVEKKLTLSKLQSTIWEKSNSQQENFSLSDLDDDLINSLIDKDSNVDDEPTYRMK